METQTHPREIDHPTASSLDRIAACPGSWLLEQKCPPGPPSEEAEFGARVHAALAGATLTDRLTPEEEECVHRCLDLVSMKFCGTPIAEQYRERRLYLRDGYGQPIFSGQIDLAMVDDEGSTVIVDYKTGRNQVPRAAVNKQLRGLVVLWDIEMNAASGKEITVAIVQPYGTPEASWSRYGEEDIIQAYQWLKDMLKQARNPDSPRHPSEEACRYCKAKSICPEALGQMAAMTKIQQDGDLIPAEASRLLDACELAESIIDSIRARSRAILASGTAIPGWKLRPGAVRETITDVQNVFRRSVEMGVDPKAFTAACSLTKKALAGLYRGIGLKGIGIDLAMNAALDGCTVRKQCEQTLVRDNGGENAKTDL